VAGLQQLNWDSEGVGSKAAALVDLSTVAGNKISNPPWVKFQSAGWVNFPSAPTETVFSTCLLPITALFRQPQPPPPYNTALDARTLNTYIVVCPRLFLSPVVQQ
jgi:hypothetical protein